MGNKRAIETLTKDSIPESCTISFRALEQMITGKLTEQCKVDACVDKFLKNLFPKAEEKDDQAEIFRKGLPPLSELQQENDSGFATRKEELLADLKEVLPRTYRAVTIEELDIHELPGIEERWSRINAMGSRGEALHKPCETASKKRKFCELCDGLRETIHGESTSSSFACGGSIPSIKVRVYWSVEKDSHARELALPLGHTPGSFPDALQQLVSDCSPATFGRASEDVLDPEYRLAGKLDIVKFTSTFHPADFGILSTIEQILLSSISSYTENDLQYRRIHAELYKLNIYSGPSGLFRSHFDTPRSLDQIGSLVICLPAPFKGGNLMVRHNGNEVDFNWAPQSQSAIQWAAFYSDCEHEIKTVSEGERITLTYNLYVDESMGANPALEASSLPFYKEVKSLMDDPTFFNQGGALGIFCSHAYAHTSSPARSSLPRTLKGSDMALYSVLKSLGAGVVVRPVLSVQSDSDTESTRAGTFVNTDRLDELFRYLEDATILDRAESGTIHVEEGGNIHDRWRTLFESRKLELDDILEELEVEDKDDDPEYGPRVGTHLHPYILDNGPCSKDMSFSEIVEGWPHRRRPDIVWLNACGYEEDALGYMAYGNEATTRTCYPAVAMIADIPSWDKRSARST